MCNRSLIYLHNIRGTTSLIIELHRTNHLNFVLIYKDRFNKAGSFLIHAWVKCVVLNHVRLGLVNLHMFIKHIRNEKKRRDSLIDILKCI